MSFLIVDTEGRDLLREIAILDHRGNLLYEALTQEHPDNAGAQFRAEPLQQILQRFVAIAKNQLVICHAAQHDQKILKANFRRASLPWQPMKFECTYELAQYHFPNLGSYSLAHLSRCLSLQVNGKYFNSSAAHSARYDAEFTYQLYLKMTNPQILTQPNPVNPFSSRVDTPFQQHPDFQPIYQDKFRLLKSIISEIRQDQNHQSRGAVVIGEPGSGKTHLMMRMAQELLQVNRLLFIRQPNNPETILYHTYTRILESFVQTVPSNGFTQLENLLAHSFVKIISTTQHLTLTERDQHILQIVQTDHLNLYRHLGAEGTTVRQKFWQHIERRVSTWWMDKYGTAGFAPQIIRGIIKFCGYSEHRRKTVVSRWLAAQHLEPEETELVALPNWNEELSREDFSLQAIAVFSCLSLLDEPLIIIFDQLEGLKYNEQLLKQFSFAVTELFTHVPNSLIIFNLFPDRWQHFQTFFDGAFIDRVSEYQVFLDRPSDEQILGILKVKLATVGEQLETTFSERQLKDILSQSSIRAILNRAAAYYRYITSGVPLPPTTNTTNAFKQDFADNSNHYDSSNLHERLLQLEQSVFQITQIFTAITAAIQNVNISSLTLQEATNNFPAIQVGNVSIADQTTALQPTEQTEIREYLQEQKKLISANYSQHQIITDNDDLGKLFTIIQTFQAINHLEIDQLRLGRKVLPEHLVIERKNQRHVIGFLGVGGSAFTSRISNYNELVLTHQKDRFYLFRDIRHGELNGKLAKQHIASLNNAENGQFAWLDQNERITFDLIYRLVSDLQNREVEFPLEIAIDTLITDYSNYWLLQILR